MGQLLCVHLWNGISLVLNVVMSREKRKFIKDNKHEQ